MAKERCNPRLAPYTQSVRPKLPYVRVHHGAKNFKFNLAQLYQKGSRVAILPLLHLAQTNCIHMA